jgi:hypothetical protein
MKREFHSVLTQLIAERIVAQGAVMTIQGFPVRHQLVGCLRWVDDTAVMWFVAHGDSERDAYFLRFDEVHLVKDVGIGFLQEGVMLAYLTGIPHAQVEDPSDYEIGWKIWQEVAPLHGPVIEKAFARFGNVRAEPAIPGAALNTRHTARTVTAA